MKARIIKLILALFIFALPEVGISNAVFSAQDTISGNVVSTGCWAKPTTPNLVYPTNGYVANIGSDWLANPYMDWSDSVTTCPTGSITYIYESYHDSGLTSLAYRSSPLGSSMIPAPGTPDGTYYWRVRAFDGTTYSDWSEVWLLTVDRTPILTPTPTPTPTPTSTPTPEVGVGDVVINEIMWMGSTSSSADEWIELRNMTNHDIDISNWRIDNAVTGVGGHLEIPAHHTIPANGYFLIANYNKADSAMNVDPDLVATNINFDNEYDDNGQLILKDDDQNPIDSSPVPTGHSWPAGENGSNKKSMERNDDPGTGWHTCINVACNDTTYWDAEGNNYGTPKSANLSENDSSAPADAAPETIEENVVETVEVATESAETVPVEEPIEEPKPEATPEAIVEEPQTEVQETVEQEPEPEPEPPAQPTPPEEIINE